MFWRKSPTFSDPQFDVMEYRHGSWAGAADAGDLGRLLVSVAGDQVRPGDTELENARHLLRRVQELSSVARNYVAQRDHGALDEANGDLVLESVDVYREVGRFDLTFGYPPGMTALSRCTFVACVRWVCRRAIERACAGLISAGVISRQEIA